MHWAYADEFKFRFAWWGFYDGLYDYTNGPWNDHRREYLARFSETDSPRQSDYFNDHNKNPRHIYATSNRVNELYFDYSSGPVFVRVGRQSISWGEADTIALLDVSNPFDLTLGAPGFFQDVDEARIPLWTLRSTIRLPDVGPFSSLFGDAYLVPGPIDTTVPINPITAGVSPFNPDVPDPQLNIIAQGAQANFVHTVIADRLPDQTWSNSRWGARLTGVLARDYTVQTWFFRTFNQAPVPLLTNASAFGLISKNQGTFVNSKGERYSDKRCGTADIANGCRAPAVTLLQRRLESVIGVATSWFSQPLNGIMKGEIEYFIGEPAFIPTQNLNPRVQVPAAFRTTEGVIKNSTATADYVRWVIGYDRNFFFRPLNPTNSFILVASYNSSFNISEKGGRDYRNANAKPGHPQTRQGPIAGNPLCQGKAAYTSALCVYIDPHDYEDAYQYEGFMQATVRTDYLHGQLQPQFTVIADVSGIFALQPSISYRLNDNLILGVTYSGISASRKAGLGTFRAHDMVQLRVTAQIN